MPAQHQIEYCHVNIKTGEILEGPMALPQSWGGVSGFHHLKQGQLRKYHWYRVRDDGVVRPGGEYTFLWLPEHETVLKVPLGDKMYRGGQRYTVLQLYQMFGFFTEMSFYSPVLGEVYKFPNKHFEQQHRNNCRVTRQDYTCLAETLGGEWVRVTVPYKDIKQLMKDSVNAHNEQLEKMFTALKDILSATDEQLVAMLDTNLADYYG